MEYMFSKHLSFSLYTAFKTCRNKKQKMSCGKIIEENNK
jgi:hypothetical protein